MARRGAAVAAASVAHNTVLHSDGCALVMVLFFRVESGKKPALHHIRVFKVLPPTAASDALCLPFTVHERASHVATNVKKYTVACP